MHDRLILYEVTGMRVRVDEFQDNSSSDCSEDETRQELLPIDYAFMERFEDETYQGGTSTYALNPWRKQSKERPPQGSFFLNFKNKIFSFFT